MVPPHFVDMRLVSTCLYPRIIALTMSAGMWIIHRDKLLLHRLLPQPARVASGCCHRIVVLPLVLSLYYCLDHFD